MPPFGISDDEIRQAMIDMFGDDGGDADTGAGGTAGLASGAALPLASNQPNGSLYQPFSPAGSDPQNQIIRGILSTLPTSGAGNGGGYTDFSFGGQGGSGAYTQALAPSAALLGNSISRSPANLPAAAYYDPNQRIANIARGNTDQSASLAAYANNPTVSSAMDTAWAQSHANGYADQRDEVNAFGRQNSNGDIWIEPASTQYNDSNTSVLPDPPGSSWLGRQVDALLGNRTIFLIHTHPNPGDPETTGPSPDDISYAKKWNLPLIIQSSDGMHYYDPAQHK